LCGEAATPFAWCRGALSLLGWPARGARPVVTDRALRIFSATFETETNTFSPLPTGWESFERNGIGRGAERVTVPSYRTGPMLTWRSDAERDGCVVIESISASADPSGRILQSVYERLREELLADLRAALPVDIVLLYLHGAMAATSGDDCAGDILRRVREIVGPATVVGTELDLHCHLTVAMIDNATAIVTFKEYPHDDIISTAHELYALCLSAARGQTQPVIVPTIAGLSVSGRQRANRCGRSSIACAQPSATGFSS
jgi:microcystin degradation protein MlrC